MKALKKIKSVASALMTIASVSVMILALCIVDSKELSWTPIIVFFAAEAWIVYAIKSACKGGRD